MTEVGSGLGSSTVAANGWRQCLYCQGRIFKVPNDFLKHIRECHCTKEGGSFVCRYGYNGVCSSLPLEGVSDKDYEDHVLKHHAFTMFSKGSSGVISKAQTQGREEKWGVFSSTQNVAAVLNDPRRGMKRDFFTRTWGESFVEIKEIPPHVALPQVTAKHVESYVRRLRRRQKLLSRLASVQASKVQDNSQRSFLTSSSRVTDQLPQEGIPNIFLSSTFNLEDPETFFSVFTHVSSSGVCVKNAKILQEKLFHYLETVEMDMSRQIARKSSAFFDTMTYLNAQMEQLKLNHSAVSALRDGISVLRQEAVLEPVKILALPRRRNNISETCKKLEVMSAVREVQSTIQVMLARQEFTAALDLISTTQDLLHTELNTIRCLKHLSSELSEHEKLIDKMVSADFIKYITEDLNRPLEDTHPFLEEDQLIAVVFGVLRLQKFDFLDNLREEIYTAIKATVKQSVVEAVSEVEVDQEIASVADQARVLSIGAWLSLLSTVTSRLNTVIARVKGITEVMVQTVEAGAGRTQPVTEGVQAASLVTMSSSDGDPMLGEVACGKVLGGLREILCQACDYAHDRCAKLLHARSRDHGLDKMTASEFLALSRIIEDFVADTESVCGRKSTSFRMGLQGQATRFVSRFHEEREARLKLNLSSERWRAVPAPPDLQHLLDHISATDTLVSPPASQQEKESIEASSTTPTSTTLANTTASTTTATLSNGVVEQNHCASGSTGSGNGSVINGSSSSSGGGVVVNGEEYIVVGVCVVVVRLIVEYSECASTLRLAAHQLLTRLTDLLRRFNSDTCRLLVEAGAVALGLKTITTRNLALAWRSLQLLLTLLPRLNTHFSVLLRPAVVTKNIEQVTREYREHCEAIEAKIVGVMSDTLERQFATWEARSPVPSPAFNGILKAVSKLHEAVSGVLPPQQMYKLFEKITSVLKEKLKVHLVRLNVSSVGPKSWVVTSELTFYFNHLESLGLGGLVSQEEFTSGLWPAR
ncbi:vacuolar protein sorting-associated protein 54-like isoform X1 [Penaeus monodon]|uniref:vacuolar protein sorting-associated protein 54-like isoform X1 n=2 Tax=Penaeus monodon TaxID=6687 RepID=UPI0018A7A1D7|nr:vacuolar protein sorting-associated protein 54-like isoform X1 [Penaeus monodon]